MNAAVREAHSRRREGRARRRRPRDASNTLHWRNGRMNTYQTQVLKWARRVRDFLVEHDPQSGLAELAVLRRELDEVVGLLTANAAAQEAITKQSRVQTAEIRRLRTTLRDDYLTPIVRMSRTMQLEVNGTGVTFVLPRPGIDSE